MPRSFWPKLLIFAEWPTELAAAVKSTKDRPVPLAAGGGGCYSDFVAASVSKRWLGEAVQKKHKF
jgi:hypothetical protein